MSGIASLAGLLLLAGVMVGGFYLRSLHAPTAVGQAGVSPSPIEVPSIGASPTDIPSPSPTTVATPVAPTPSSAPPAPADAPARPAPTCPAEVITSFTARAAPDAVILAWTVSGGCGDETGWIGGQFTGTMYPGYWNIPIHRAWATYTDHPHKPAGAQQECNFSLTYAMDLNGTAPDGRGVPPSFAQVSNVNLC
jgi:hypothetical protein